jgi:hypothetical protein
MVKNQSGFEYLPERPKADSFVKQKWGWRGVKAGALCRGRVTSNDGRSLGCHDQACVLSAELPTSCPRC